MNRRRWLLVFVAAACCAVLVPIAVGTLLIQRHPLLDAAPAAEVDDATRTRQLVKRTWRSLKETGGTLPISEAELNSALAFVARGTGRIRGRARVAPGGITATFTVQIPDTPFGEYLNLWAVVATETEGIQLVRVVLGDLEIPGAVAQPLLRLALDLILGNRTGTFAFSKVQSVRADGTSVLLTLERIPDLRERIDRIKTRFKRVRDQVALLGDPEIVRRYYTRLTDVDRALPQDEPGRLNQFLPPLFQLARDRGGDPVAENRAAILALAMFLGSQRFQSFIGPVHTEQTRSHPLQHPSATLAGRADLRLHFLVSAGLKVVADSGLSHAVGEFKELMDASWGGSGFSFADLAADRAGVRFAETALDGSGGARRLQDLLSIGIKDSALIPDPGSLPEGLTREEFTAFFGDVESPAYRTLVAAIDGCVGTSPLHSPGAPTDRAAAVCDLRAALPAGLLGHLEVRQAKARTPSRVHTLQPQRPPAPVSKPSKTQVDRRSARPTKPGTASAPHAEKQRVKPEAAPLTLPPQEQHHGEQRKTTAPAPVVQPIPTPQAPETPSPAERELQSLRNQREELLERYTPRHPDVRSVQRRIDALTTEGSGAE